MYSLLCRLLMLCLIISLNFKIYLFDGFAHSLLFSSCLHAQDHRFITSRCSQKFHRGLFLAFWVLISFMSVNLQTHLFQLSFHCSWYLSLSLIQFCLFLVRGCLHFYLCLELNLIISELFPFVSCPSLLSLCISVALSCSTILWVTYVSNVKNLCSSYLGVENNMGHI